MMLVEVGEDDFAWMLGERNAPDRGLRLPAAGIDREIATHVRKAVARVRQLGCRNNWMMVAAGEVVGLCGFKHPPQDGEVEIAYNVWPECQRRGHATRAIEALIAHAKQDASVSALTAETTIDNTASHRVLEANGFQRTGTRNDPQDGELIRWRLTVARP